MDGQDGRCSHGTKSTYERHGCRCNACVEAMRERWRLKNLRQKARGHQRPPRPSRYIKTSALCLTCGGRVNHKHGHRHDQCWNCRAAQDAAERKDAHDQKLAEWGAARPKCTQCGKKMATKVRGRICADCLRIDSWQIPCAKGCGRAMQATVAKPTPICAACWRPHGAIGWKNGCRCDVCDRAHHKLEVNGRAHSPAKAKRGRDRKRAATRQIATRSGPYSPAEDAIVMRSDLTAVRRAVILGRTLDSVQMRKKRLGNPVPYGYKPR